MREVLRVDRSSVISGFREAALDGLAIGVIAILRILAATAGGQLV